VLSNILQKLINVYKGYSRPERLFVMFMMICSFAITAEAAITRSIATSFFIDVYGAKFFPYAWIASLPLNFAVVAFYNRFIPRFGCGKLMGVILCFTVVFNLFCIHFLQSIYSLPFFFFLWKDIFVIFMFHKIWSVINSTMNISRAKYIYGLFYGCGGVGAVVGSMVPSFFAVSYGTSKLLYATLPFYLITYVCYISALRMRDRFNESEDLSMNIDNGNFSYGVKLIKNSKLLKFILLLVLGMQVSSTILEYQFNHFLKDSFSALDLRTQFVGRLFGIVNLVNTFLQFVGSFVLVRIIGLKWTHAIIPLLLISNTVMFFLFPSFGLICIGFGMIKSLDYSIFGIVKEMLYIPLNVEEKFKAKSVIDVFAYRSSKTIASLLILTLTFFYGHNITAMLSLSLIVIFCVWIYSVLSMNEHFADIELQKAPNSK
jgi:ATP:ADP antiporter, AAA family